MNEIAKALQLAPSTEMEKRHLLAQEFYRVVLDPDEPLFVADDVTVWGVCFQDDEATLIENCRRHYGVTLNHDQFNLPLWQVLDFLEACRTPQQVDTVS